MDSNHRRRKPADLQSAPFGHSGICPFSHFNQHAIPHHRASCRIRTNDPEITNHVLWPTELKRQAQKSNRYVRSVSETAANLGIYFLPAKFSGKNYLLRCFSLCFTSCFSNASKAKSTASSNVSHTLLA